MKIVDLRVTVVGTPWRELVFLELTTGGGLSMSLDERLADVDHCPRVGVLESELHHRHPSPHRR